LLISVIVPVYNTAYYLPKCIRSLLRQTHKELEILLVDDGSTDGSGAICDRYALRDDRIRVIHKANGGVSSARNAGLDAASGQYVAFVDSDDWLPEKALDCLVKKMEEDRADWCGGAFEVLGPIRTEKVDYFRDAAGTDDSEEQDHRVSSFVGCIPYIHSCCGMLFRMDIIRRHSLRFSPAIQFGEDTFFTLAYIGHCETMTYTGETVYNYSRIVSGNACGKFHPSLYLWEYEYLERLHRLLSQHGACVSNDYLCGCLRNICFHYFRHVDREQAVRYFESIRNQFSQYVEAEGGENESNVFWNLLKEKQYDSLYDYFASLPPEKFRYVKNLIRKILKIIKRILFYKLMV
jgi:Glycosyltransferases involved in cell wall biogenesis